MTISKTTETDFPRVGILVVIAMALTAISCMPIPLRDYEGSEAGYLVMSIVAHKEDYTGDVRYFFRIREASDRGRGDFLVYDRYNEPYKKLPDDESSLKMRHVFVVRMKPGNYEWFEHYAAMRGRRWWPDQTENLPFTINADTVTYIGGFEFYPIPYWDERWDRDALARFRLLPNHDQKKDLQIAREKRPEIRSLRVDAHLLDAPLSWPRGEE
jgi:hypothetical protein